MIIPQPVQAHITFLKTRHLETTTTFYTQVLGFSLALDQGACRIFRIRPHSYVGFCTTEGETGSSEVILTLVVDDVDAYARDVQARGAEIEIGPRFNEQYLINQMFLRDPNGYRIEVQRFEDPRWEDNP
jgi:catechol 2,3-dioxygenase-like lactoylglutathione lyase family enzyme